MVDAVKLPFIVVVVVAKLFEGIAVIINKSEGFFLVVGLKTFDGTLVVLKIMVGRDVDPNIFGSLVVVVSILRDPAVVALVPDGEKVVTSIKSGEEVLISKILGLLVVICLCIVVISKMSWIGVVKSMILGLIVVVMSSCGLFVFENVVKPKRSGPDVLISKRLWSTVDVGGRNVCILKRFGDVVDDVPKNLGGKVIGVVDTLKGGKGEFGKVFLDGSLLGK